MTVSFVAEVSSNHNKNLNRCLHFIDTAALIGCDAVKFQLFRIDQLFAPEILDRSGRHRSRREWELPFVFLPPIADRCRELGLRFGCTPFDLNAVDALLPYVDFYKIASYELLWSQLLDACARTRKPVVLSTGMANLDECRTAVTHLYANGCTDLTLLHCVSDYPAHAAQANLACINTIRQSLNCKTGWSDHTVNPGVIYRAIHRFGASMIEFHLDLEGQGVEFETRHCWLPEQIRPVIAAARDGFSADGNGVKIPAPSEEQERLWRTDPKDGLRPLSAIRATFQG